MRTKIQWRIFEPRVADIYGGKFGDRFFSLPQEWKRKNILVHDSLTILEARAGKKYTLEN